MDKHLKAKIDELSQSKVAKDLIRRVGGAPSTASRAMPWFIAGACVGAAAAFLLDPTQGRKRRSLMVDKGAALSKDAKTYSDKILDSARGIVGKLRGDSDDTDNEASAKEESKSYIQ